MYKKIINTLFLIAFFIIGEGSAYAQINTLNGKVKILEQGVENYGPFIMELKEEINYGQYPITLSSIFDEIPENDQPTKNSFLPCIKRFNYNQQILSDSFQDKGFYNIYTYDSTGNLLSKKTCFGNASSATVKYGYAYLNKKYPSVLATEISYGSGDADNRFNSKAYTYDSLGNNIKTVEILPYGAMHISTYDYTNNRLLIKESMITLSANQEEQYKDGYIGDTIYKNVWRTYEYSLSGKIKTMNLQLLMSNIKGLAGKVLFTYDTGNRKIEMRCYRGNKLLRRKRYHYNDDNSIKRINVFDGEENESKNYAEYFYDSNKILTSAILYSDGKHSTIKFDYIYDHRGNWIAASKSVDGEIAYKRWRRISYYE